MNWPTLLASIDAASSLPNPVVMVIVLGVLTLAPFVLIMLTSFVKISVVLSILRNALGTQSVPPNQVITGLAFVLSLFVMTPVAKQMYNEAGTISETKEMFSEASIKTLVGAAERGREPLRYFLAKHAHDQDRILFMELANRLERSSYGPPLRTTRNLTPDLQLHPASEVRVAPDRPVPPVDVNSKNDFQVLIPSFVTSQLKEAFEIGFLVFVPFIIIDMVTANILLAMGMSMLSPSVISLPFKLLLFVLVDGWYLIIRGLVLSYA